MLVVIAVVQELIYFRFGVGGGMVLCCCYVAEGCEDGAVYGSGVKQQSTNDSLYAFNCFGGKWCACRFWCGCLESYAILWCGSLVWRSLESFPGGVTIAFEQFAKVVRHRYVNIALAVIPFQVEPAI